MEIVFREIFKEHPSEVVFPDDTKVIPGQDTSITELLDRFTRGQRLNVKCRPENPLVTDYDMFDEHGRYVGIKEGEDDELFQPLIDNPADLDDYLEAQRNQLREYKSKSKDMSKPAEEKPAEEKPAE